MIHLLSMNLEVLCVMTLAFVMAHIKARTQYMSELYEEIINVEFAYSKCWTYFPSMNLKLKVVSVVTCLCCHLSQLVDISKQLYILSGIL